MSRSYYLLDLYVYEVFDPPANITRHIFMLRLKKFRFMRGDYISGPRIQEKLI